MRELSSYKTYRRVHVPKTEELASGWRACCRSTARSLLHLRRRRSIDTAAKLARAYWGATGKPDKHVIISRQFAYHGSNAYGTSLGGMEALVQD